MGWDGGIRAAEGGRWGGGLRQAQDECGGELCNGRVLGLTGGFGLVEFLGIAGMGWGFWGCGGMAGLLGVGFLLSAAGLLGLGVLGVVAVVVWFWFGGGFLCGCWMVGLGRFPFSARRVGGGGG